MGDLINKTTFIRNIIISIIFGLVVPYLLYTYLDPTGYVLNRVTMLTNGVIFIAIYSLFGFFKKETVIRFIIGIVYIGIVVYFYSVGHTIFTIYLPHCGFGHLCLEGTIFEITLNLSYIYIYTGILLITLKALNLLRHLVKPPEIQNKYKTAVLKTMRLRKE